MSCRVEEARKVLVGQMSSIVFIRFPLGRLQFVDTSPSNPAALDAELPYSVLFYCYGYRRVMYSNLYISSCSFDSLFTPLCFFEAGVCICKSSRLAGESALES